jgi:hypothetical protein
MTYNYFVTAMTPYQDNESRKQMEKLVPYSEAKVFRTTSGFIIRDKEDDDWCKYIPFDDIDRLQTDIACKKLDPAIVKAMEEMPLPEYVKIPEKIIKELQQTIEESYEESSKEDRTVHISALTSDIDVPDIPSTMQLSREDMLQHQFGTLNPYVEDYLQDTYEIEENHATHLPKLSKSNQRGSSKYGPLSYQHTVLKNDPIITEDFDTPKQEERRSGSLYCSGSSEYGSEEEDEDYEEDIGMPSSLNPSKEEEDLYHKEATIYSQSRPSEKSKSTSQNKELENTNNTKELGITSQDKKLENTSPYTTMRRTTANKIDKALKDIEEKNY